MTSEDVGHATIGGAELSWAALTDVGRHRALNEDALVVAPPVFVVADGMGGHDAGEVASALTVQRMGALGASGPLAVDDVSHELHHINSLLRHGVSTDTDSVMGTTGVGLAIVDNGGVTSWLVFNVGDSRAYAWADGSLSQVSRDHSFVQELVDAGEIQPEEARSHPHRNVVTQALGADPEIRPDYWIRPLRPNERYLLCSDGLTGEVPDDVLATVLGSHLAPSDVAATLVGLALESGGRDNITVIVVDVVSVASWDDPSTERNSQKLALLRAQMVGDTTAERPRPAAPTVAPAAVLPLISDAPRHHPAPVEPAAAAPSQISSVPEGLAAGEEAQVEGHNADAGSPLIAMPAGLGAPEAVVEPPPPLTAGDQVDLDALRTFKEARSHER